MIASVFVWCRDNRERLLVLFGILLVGILCFEAGLIQGKMKQGASLVITLPSTPGEVVVEKRDEGVTGDLAKTSLTQVETIATRAEVGDCPFVGSKNSNKYHLASCAVAKRIKPENRVCFRTQDEARARGYLASCLK